MEVTLRTPFSYQVIVAAQIYPKFAFVQLGRRIWYLWRDYPPGMFTLGIKAEEWAHRRRVRRDA